MPRPTLVRHTPAAASRPPHPRLRACAPRGKRSRRSLAAITALAAIAALGPFTARGVLADTLLPPAHLLWLHPGFCTPWAHSPPSLRQNLTLPPEFVPVAGHVRLCGLHPPAGPGQDDASGPQAGPPLPDRDQPATVRLITVQETAQPPARPGPPGKIPTPGNDDEALPRPWLVGPDGRCLARLPLLFPTEWPAELQLWYGRWQGPWPGLIRVQVRDPRVGGDFELPALRRDPDTGRYEAHPASPGWDAASMACPQFTGAMR